MSNNIVYNEVMCISDEAVVTIQCSNYVSKKGLSKYVYVDMYLCVYICTNS